MIIRDGLRSLVGTLCGACIVTLVALGFGAAPAKGSFKKMFRKCSRDINDRKIIGSAKTACG
jgi:hypothetical protein